MSDFSRTPPSGRSVVAGGGVGLKSDTGCTRAFDEARRLGHHWVGEEHLLLALSRQDGRTGEALRAAGATPERLEQSIVAGVERSDPPAECGVAGSPRGVGLWRPPGGAALARRPRLLAPPSPRRRPLRARDSPRRCWVCDTSWRARVARPPPEEACRRAVRASDGDRCRDALPLTGGRSVRLQLPRRGAPRVDRGGRGRRRRAAGVRLQSDTSASVPEEQMSDRGPTPGA